MNNFELLSEIKNSRGNNDYIYMNKNISKRYSSKLSGKIMILATYFDNSENYYKFLTTAMFRVVKRENLECKFNNAVIVLYIDSVEYKIIKRLMKELCSLIKKEVTLYYKLDIQTIFPNILNRKSVFSSNKIEDINQNNLERLIIELYNKVSNLNFEELPEFLKSPAKTECSNIKSIYQKIV